MSDKNNKSRVVEFSVTSDKADSRRHARREAKATSLRKRFSAARGASESPSRAADRLKKLFKKPD